MRSGARAHPASSAALVCAAAAVCLSACGGSHHGRTRDPAAVTAAVQHAFSALADGRGRRFCALLDGGARARLSRAVHATCPRVVALVTTRLSDSQRRALRHVRVSAVTVTGDRAVVRDRALSAGAGSLTGFIGADGGATRLARGADGGWRISG